MRKAIGFLALVIGVAVVAAPEFTPLDAQDKTKKKEDPKAKVAKDKEKEKDKKGEAAAGGTVEVYKAKDGYRFRVKDAGGKTLAMPARGQEEKDDVLKTIEQIKAILNSTKPTDAKD